MTNLLKYGIIMMLKEGTNKKPQRKERIKKMTKIEKVIAKKVKEILKNIKKAEKRGKNFFWISFCSLNIQERLENLGYNVEKVDGEYSRVSW